MRVETVAGAEPTADAGAGAGAKTHVAGGLLCSSPRAFLAPLCARQAGLAAKGVLCFAWRPSASPRCWVGSRGGLGV